MHKLVAGELTRQQVVDIARGGTAVELDPDTERAVEATRRHIDALAAAEEPTYGVSTGFGALAVRHIPAERRTALQQSFVRSHAAGAGPAVEAEVVRSLMLLRLRTISTGHTGARLSTARALAAALNAGIVPVVQQREQLSLLSHKLDVSTPEVYTSEGVPVLTTLVRYSTAAGDAAALHVPLEGLKGNRYAKLVALDYTSAAREVLSHV